MRFVRPSWVRVSVDHNSNDPKPINNGTGPRSRTGTVSVEFLSRIKGQAVSFLSVVAIGSEDGSTVDWRIVDLRTGRVVFSETVTQ